MTSVNFIVLFLWSIFSRGLSKKLSFCNTLQGSRVPQAFCRRFWNEIFFGEFIIDFLLLIFVAGLLGGDK